MSGGSSGVEQATRDPKVKGANLAASGTGKICEKKWMTSLVVLAQAILQKSFCQKNSGNQTLMAIVWGF